jgi:hypothetical protein
MGDETFHTKFRKENLYGRGDFGDIGVDVEIILNEILKNHNV